MEDLEQQVETQIEPVETANESISLRDEIEQAAKAARERDEQGRFKAKEAAEPVEKAEPIKVEQTKVEAPEVKPEAQEQQEQQEPSKVDRPSVAPNSWSAAAKAKWAELPADIQAEIARREADVHREFTKQDGERQIGKTMRQVIEPYMPLIAQQGGNPVQVVKNMLETARILHTGDPATKASAIRSLIQSVGIDPQSLIGEQQYMDPTVQNLQQRLAQFEHERAQQQYQAQQQQQAELQNAIATFAADPKNAHFEHVKEHMAALLQNGLAKDLQDAYDQAVYARPDIRSNLLAEQQRMAEEKRLADVRAKADAARRAAGSVTGSPGLGASTDPQAGQRDLRAELKAALAAHRL